MDSVWVWPTVRVSSTCLCSSIRISGQCVGVTYCKGVLYLLVFICQDQWTVCGCDLLYGCPLLACVHLSGSVDSVWVWPTVRVSSTCLCSSVRISWQCVGVTYCKGVLYLLVFICQDQWTVCGCDLLYGCPLLACVHLSGSVDSVWVWPTVRVSSTCLCSSVRISGQCVSVTYCKGVLYLLVFICQDQLTVCGCDIL